MNVEEMILPDPAHVPEERIAAVLAQLAALPLGAVLFELVDRLLV